MDDESLWGRSDIIKRITRYQRQCRPTNIAKDNAFILGCNTRGLHNIFVLSLHSGYPERVAGSDLAQVPEERVAMRRQADITRCTWKRGSWDMTDATSQSTAIVSFDHNGGYINRRH